MARVLALLALAVAVFHVWKGSASQSVASEPAKAAPPPAARPAPAAPVLAAVSAGGPTVVVLRQPSFADAAAARPPAAPALVSRPRPALPPEPPQEPPPPGTSRVTGVIFNLVTGQPVSGVHVTLAGGPYPHDAFTDARGRYRLQVGAADLAGFDWTLECSAPGYRPGQFEDDQSYRQWSARDRKELADSALDQELDPVPLRYNGDDSVVTLDMALVPSR